MNAEDYRLLKDAFHAAADLPPDERPDLYARLGLSESLRERVDVLLSVDESTPRNSLDAIVDRTLEQAVHDHPDMMDVPETIDGFRILRRIGEGGSGVVFEAEQDTPRRIVALKLLRLGLSSGADRRRFAREAEILGRLHHPGVAPIHGAGVADIGGAAAPYFIMAFVRGRPLDRYLAERRPTLEERVELLARVGDAVHHAHQQGVVHRDLKPGNILVEDEPDGPGRPRVLDFGIARLIESDAPANVTRTGHVIGTIPYMSPEQIRGTPGHIDVRTDIHALGVILYEALTGHHPFADIARRSLPEAARIICEQVPPPLSAHDRALRGDLETIVGAALAKDPAARYPSASELTGDLRRFLRHEPIVARPATTLYHVRMFVRRHRALVGGAMLAVLSLVIGLVIAVVALREEATQRTLAETRLAESEFRTYVAEVAMTFGALGAADVPEAMRRLSRLSPELSGWEASHIAGRLDESLRVLDVPDDSSRPRWLGLIDDDRTLWGIGGGREGGSPCVAWDIETGAIRPTNASIPAVLPRDRRRSQEITFGPSTDGATYVVLDRSAGVVTVYDPLHDGRVDTYPLPPVPADEDRRTEEAPDGRLIVHELTPGTSLVLSEEDEWTVLDNRRSRSVSPDGAWVAEADSFRSRNGAVRIWRVDTGALVHSWRVGDYGIASVAIGPGGRALAMVGNDLVLRLWRCDGAAPVEAWHRDGLAEGDYTVPLVTMGRDGTRGFSRCRELIFVWDVESGEVLARARGHAGAVRAPVACGASLMAAAAEDRRVRIWDLDAPDEPTVLRGHTRFVYATALSPDGTTIASGGWDDVLRLWDAATGAEIAAFAMDQLVLDLAWSADGASIACLSARQESVRPSRVTILSARTGQVRHRLDGLPSDASIAALPDGSGFIVVGRDRDGAPICFIDDATGSIEPVPLGVDGGVSAIECADGVFAIGLGGGDVVLFDTGRRIALRRFIGHAARVTAITFDRTGERMVSVDEAGEIMDWDVASATGRRVGTAPGTIFDAVFSPDGRRLATGGVDGVLRLWETASWREVAQLRGHAAYVHAVDWSRDGTRLVSGSGDNTVRIWETQPLIARLDAMRTRRGLVRELRPLVDDAFDECGDDPGRVASRIETLLPGATPERRAVAMQLVLGRVSRRHAEDGRGAAARGQDQ